MGRFCPIQINQIQSPVRPDMQPKSNLNCDNHSIRPRPKNLHANLLYPPKILPILALNKRNRERYRGLQGDLLLHVQDEGKSCSFTTSWLSLGSGRGTPSRRPSRHPGSRRRRMARSGRVLHE